MRVLARPPVGRGRREPLRWQLRLQEAVVILALVGGVIAAVRGLLPAHPRAASGKGADETGNMLSLQRREKTCRLDPEVGPTDTDGAPSGVRGQGRL